MYPILMVLYGALVASTMAWAEIVVVDDMGHEVLLHGPAQRIVSLAPHTTEMLFAVGAGDAVVAVDRYSDHPLAATHVPKVGDGNGFDLEAIVALRPDLVLGWHSGNPMGQLDKLKALGVVVYISEPLTLEAIAMNLVRLGQLAGTEAKAHAVAQSFRNQIRQLRERYGSQDRIKVFYQIWDKPLMTVSDSHVISSMMDLCGGRNVFSSFPLLAPQVDKEAVLAADPEVIIAGGIPESTAAWMTVWRHWPSLTAVKYDNLFTVPVDLIHRQGPRILEGARLMCEHLELARTRRRP